MAYPKFLKTPRLIVEEQADGYMVRSLHYFQGQLATIPKDGSTVDIQDLFSKRVS